MILHSYFRSSCSWRVRNVLALKGIQYEYQAVNLLTGAHLGEDYEEVNPMKQVPCLEVDGHKLVQSLSIMEYLEEAYPEPALLPKDPFQRAKVREVCELIGSGIQPLQNLSVLRRLAELTNSADTKAVWGREVIGRGLRALERLLAGSAGRCCVGDQVTLADCCLLPQVYNAHRFNVEMSEFPIISRVCAYLETLDAFIAAHPSKQPDCPAELR